LNKALIKSVLISLLSVQLWVPSSIAARNQENGPSGYRLMVKLTGSQGVTGYESEVRDAIRGALPASLRTKAKEDELGSLILQIGAGSPTTIIAVPMDEVGYVVSEITDDGYIRLNRVGRGMPSPLWDQFYEGQPIVIRTERGPVPGVTACLSIHLQPGRFNPFPARVTSLDDLWVDVGASSRAEVEKIGVRLLNPLALRDRVTELANGQVAGIAAGNRAGCAALIELAYALESKPPSTGAVALVWLAQEWFGRKGSDRLANEFKPREVILIDSSVPSYSAPNSDQSIGASGVLGRGPILWAGSDLLATAGKLNIAHQVRPVGNSGSVAGNVPPALRSSYTAGPEWGQATVERIELPTAYNGSVVETASEHDASALGMLLAGTLGIEAPRANPNPPMSQEDGSTPVKDGAAIPGFPTAEVLRTLIETPSVSGHEARMREAVTRMLPAWAKPVVDGGGNLSVTVGTGKPCIAFLAHMDEIGYIVDKINPDGTMSVEFRGGGIPKLYEGHPAVVHSAKGDIAGFQTPLSGYTETPGQTAERNGAAGQPGRGARAIIDSLYIGTSSSGETEAMGIKAGDWVTIPKRFQMLAEGRATARSIDDRNGCAALVAAVRALDPAKLKKKVTFVWTTGEETGLDGAKYFSQHMEERPDYVFAIDTFVSSDSPLETRRFAYAPLGKGAVIRALDNSNVVPLNLVDRVLKLAASKRIAVQYGVTGGGNDGAVFTRYGTYNIPLAWPLRYAHSPAEVIDLRDLEALRALVNALVEAF
jgi:putative aminopeptidase FrvX